MKLSLRPCTMLDILTIYGDLCQDELDQVAALAGPDNASDFAYTVWGLGHPRFCLCETATLHPVAVFGVTQLATPKHYQTWMLTQEQAWRASYAREITQNVGHIMAETFKELGAEQFHITVLARRLLAQKWYVKLGFVKSAEKGDFAFYTYCGEMT